MIEKGNLNFIEEIIKTDLEAGKYTEIITRFPPEPNGYLHLGHASSICLNFGITQKFNGYTNLRFDDTNPITEETEYVESIIHDIKWLGFQWKNMYFASDYFDKLYEFAVALIKNNLAYVDDSTSEEIASQKGTPTQAGIPNIYRSRTVEENLLLFQEMKDGKYADGQKVLRAKIDLSSSNMLMRDPIMYRIKHAHHHRTGDKWCIYPMYDFAHGQSDSIENITHSICTLEFAPHRELYDWFILKLNIFPSHQYEFARRNISYTVMSKRKLLQLVNQQIVDGWDDPRMPTISGLRRRGFPPESIVEFCNKIGIGKRENSVDISLLEYCVREQLNKTAERRMVVLDPVKVTITNYEGEEEIQTENNPEVDVVKYRTMPFTSELYIEREDFLEIPTKKFHRLTVGNYVRLKSAYIIQCNEVIKDSTGKIIELKCTYFPNSKSGNDTSELPAKGVIHWVSSKYAIPVEVRLYDRLFMVENVDAAENGFLENINPNSLVIINNAFAEPILQSATLEDRFQFLRKGYFCLDTHSNNEKLIFNRTATLKDTWMNQPDKLTNKTDKN